MKYIIFIAIPYDKTYMSNDYQSVIKITSVFVINIDSSCIDDLM